MSFEETFVLVNKAQWLMEVWWKLYNFVLLILRLLEDHIDKETKMTMKKKSLQTNFQ